MRARVGGVREYEKRKTCLTPLGGLKGALYFKRKLSCRLDGKRNAGGSGGSGGGTLQLV